MKRKLLFLFIAIISSGLAFGQTTCYPDAANYNTGTTDGSSFTETSVIHTQANTDRGWARFNTSAIPDGDDVSDVELHIYVSDDNWAYFRTMSIESDPLTGTAASVYTDCSDGTRYAQYASNFSSPGWYIVDLGTTADTDLKGLLGSDWFAVGLYEYESGTSYYLEYDGWNETNQPYIVVTHTAPPTCPDPSAQAATSVTANAADLSWDIGASETDWNIEWKADSDFTPGSGAEDGSATPSTNPSYSMSSLTSSTTYYWYVQANCGVGDESTWVGPSTFTTACAVVTSLSEDFSSSSTPSCWTNSGTENWLFSTSAGYGAGAAGDHTPGGGTNYAWIDGSSGVGTNELLTPFVDVSGLTTPAFEFYYFSNNTNEPGDDNTLTVSFWDGTAWNTLLTYSGDNASWQKGLYDLSAYTITGDVQFRFVVTETAIVNAYWNDILVDDISVLELPNCLTPSTQVTSSITTISAELGWTEIGSATLWDIEFGTNGFTPTGNPTQTSVTNPYTYGSLTANTSYDWYVRSNCGGTNGESSWVGPSTFTTLCDAVQPAAFPWNEGFENGGLIPDCWSQEFVTGTTDWTYEDGGHEDFSNIRHPSSANTGSYNALFFNGSFTTVVTKLVTPALDLSGATSPILYFSHTQAEWPNDQDELRVYYRTSATGSWTLIPNAEWTEDIPDWTRVGFFLPEPSSEYYIAFEATGNYGYGVALDDVQVVAVPPVPLSDWAIYLGILLIAGYSVFRFRRKLA